MSRASRHGVPRGRRSKGAIAAKALASIVTSIAILGIFLAMVVTVPLPGLADDASGRTPHTVAVSQTALQTVCPARMQLADTGSYGDSAYRVSEGDITGQTRFSAFGSLYDATVSGIDGTGEQKTADIDTTQSDKAFVHTTGAGKSSLLGTTRVLEANAGSGSASSTASWATKGDLRGVSAARCVTPQLTQSLLLPPTQTGWTQQLVISNPTDKATAVSIRAWGTKDSNPVTLSTDSKVTVPGRGESVVSISAAAPAQDGVFVNLSSETTQVTAIVRVVHMDGLTDRGSDFAVPVGSPAKSLVLPAIAGGTDVNVLGFSETSGRIEISWMTKSGVKRAKTVNLSANRVQSIALGKAPADATAIRVDADMNTYAAAMCTDSGADQSDFSLVYAQEPQRSSAIAIPDKTGVSFALANTSGRKTTVTLTGYDNSGAQTGQKELTIDAGRAIRVPITDIAKNGAAAVRLDDSDTAVAWGGTVAVDAVSKAKVKGIASIGAVSLMPVKAMIRSGQTLDIVH
ncbi:DUF5719 family protein [Bifidobacterium catulorum]|uniref:Organic solvents resistance ABC transporter permease n=1 Tax=Bifidobacterium catulorum TaxID=1630173 RepID=A0A2U2MVG3_9BIFI|nr:DUF5719 family protein [Bifidobacterium catulorum]PWG60839.1 hypothetical protein DF200_01035 [Bifidobacterium catulorum]